VQIEIYQNSDITNLSLQVDSVDMEEELLHHKLKMKDKSPPALHLLMVYDGLKLAYIIGEGVIIYCQTVSVLDLLILLIAVYYIFDLNYPEIYGQLLSFIQQFVLEQPYTYFRGTNFQNFAAHVKMESKKG